MKCGDLVVRPFDPLRIQVSVDTSDVQHQKVVCQLVHPVIPGFSVPSVSQDTTSEPTLKKIKTK